MILRMFDTAIAPEDIERAKELFVNEVRPAFEAFDGCHGIDLYISNEEHSGGYQDVVAMSRWDSAEQIEKAVTGPEYQAALVELKKLFQQNPIVRHFESAE